MGGTGSGRKRKPGTLLRDAIEGIDIEGIINSLTSWAKGKEITCPHCNEPTGAYTADTVALQSAIELLNRKLGKPVQKNIDIVANIQLTGDDIDRLVELYLPMIVEGYKPQVLALIEGDFKPIDNP
jgi:hypothetical protein